MFAKDAASQHRQDGTRGLPAQAGGRSCIQYAAEALHVPTGEGPARRPDSSVQGTEAPMSETTAQAYISVRRVQCALNARGASLTVDGKWGPRTADALERLVDRSFDYAYTYPPDGSAVVMVSPALSRALVCSATPAAAEEIAPPSSSAGWWIAGALAVTGVALLIWGSQRA
jgi:hypothetical protein